MASSASFAGYPDAVEGPDTGYTPKEETNPVLRGLPLAIGAALYVFPCFQSTLRQVC